MVPFYSIPIDMLHYDVSELINSTMWKENHCWSSYGLHHDSCCSCQSSLLLLQIVVAIHVRCQAGSFRLK